MHTLKKQYQWILFDADETLFRFDAYAGLKLMFSHYHVDFTPADFAEYQLVNKPLWLAYQDGEIDAHTLQVTRFQGWAEKLAVTPEALNQGFLTAMADICEKLPHVDELLTQLQGRYKLGIITNGFTALQQIRLERTGLADMFDLLVISEEVGVAKPDKAIFDYALTQMDNIEPSQVLMVGDTLSSDVLGGINASIDTCWYNPLQHAADSSISATYTVTDHLQLAELLA